MGVIQYLVVFLLTNFSVNGLEIIPERAAITYINPKFVKDVHINVRRYSRSSGYVLNMEGTILHTWANNVSVQFIFYEFLHNEYKRSFIEMHFKTCDLVNKDPFVSPVFKKIGIVCPMPAGHYNLPNLTLVSVPAVDDLPYKWPFEKGKIVALLHTFPEKELIGEGYAIASFKQSNKRNKS